MYDTWFETLQGLLICISTRFLNGKCIYIAVLSFTHTHTHHWQQATMQGAGLTIWSNLGFCVLPKDTSACVQEGLGANRQAYD